MFRYLVTMLLLMGIRLGIQAQETPQKGYPYERTELSVGIALHNSYGNDYDSNYPSSLLNRETPMDDYHAGKFYIDEMKSSPTVWVNIFHHISKHWAVGLQGCYGYSMCQRYRSLTAQKDGKLDLHDFIALWSLRYYYCIHQKYSFYSGISLGFNKQLYKHYDASEYSAKTYMIEDATIFGFLVGTKFYGFSEITTNVRGLVRAGVGYRW